MKQARLSLSAAALAAAGALALPSATPAFSLNGVVLSLAQRDFRIYNNFVDPTANDSTATHPNFPGTVGATLSIWKSAVEWDSLPHGDGAGDGTQPLIGSGGANLDHTYQGAATSAGVPGDNIVSATGPGCGSACGGITEFAAGGGNNGWRIRINDPDLAWDDAPGAIAGNLYDIQSTACHEFGHTVGLGHTSGTGCTRPTMVGGPIAGDTCRRSIEADDIGGVQAVYGVASSTKPSIAGLSGGTQTGSVLTILGANFAATGNDVWFTKATPDGNPLLVSGLPSSGGGTSIAVTIPANAADGDVLVRIAAGTAGSALSNAWPLDIGAGPPPAPPVLTSVSPGAVAIYGYPMPTITLTGTDLGSVTTVNLGGGFLTGSAISASATQVTFGLPLLPALGPTPVSVTAPSGTSNSLSLQVDAVDPPYLEVVPLAGTGFPLNVATWTLPGRPVIPALSTSNLPSNLPGIVDLALGDNFTNFFFFQALPASVTQGSAVLSLVVPSGTLGLTVFFQSVTIPSPVTTPFPTSNLSQTYVAF
ncbi:MAG TPA: matrixin family metalloprotease [Planctomycetota bacterium]|jgi:hypothetical protein|nr:matrixin family metalloprotease [Planctomycetota bacterium]